MRPYQVELAARHPIGSGLRRIPLTRNGRPLLHNYCAFWSRENSGYYVEEFAEILKGQFPETE